MRGRTAGPPSCRRWRARRRLAPLLRRPRSRELLDRAGLITGLVLDPIASVNAELAAHHARRMAAIRAGETPPSLVLEPRDFAVDDVAEWLACRLTTAELLERRFLGAGAPRRPHGIIRTNGL